MADNTPQTAEETEKLIAILEDKAECERPQNRNKKNKLRQKKWNETIEKLRKNICPQCNKIRPKLDIYPTTLDFNAEDAYEVQVIMCNKCLAELKDAQSDAIIEYKDLELKMKDKDIKILKLKLDFYSDSDGDYYDDSEDNTDSESSESEKDSPVRERGRRNHHKNCDQNHEKKEKTQEQLELEETKKNHPPVFNFKNLKVPVKKIPKRRPGSDSDE